jgi:beta-N-acetylhexosaminidase
MAPQQGGEWNVFPGLPPATNPLDLADAGQAGLEAAEAAFEKGAPAVVLAHALYSMDDFGRLASLSRKVATDLLRGDLRLRGVAITDDLGTRRSAPRPPCPTPPSRPSKADMVWISGPASDQQAAYVGLLRAVQRGQVSRRRLTRPCTASWWRSGSSA